MVHLYPCADNPRKCESPQSSHSERSNQDAFIAALLADDRYFRTFAYSFTRNPDTAEELFQETWVVALRYQYRADLSSVRSWFTMLMRHLHIKISSKKRRHGFVVMSDLLARTDLDGHAGAEVFPDPRASTEPEFMRREASQTTICIEQIIDRLTDRTRTAFRLRLNEKLSFKEIGLRIGMTPKGAKDLVWRARRTIHQRLKARGLADDRWCCERSRSAAAA